MFAHAPIIQWLTGTRRSGRSVQCDVYTALIALEGHRAVYYRALEGQAYKTWLTCPLL